MKSNSTLEIKLQEAVGKGLIVSKPENNPYLKHSYKGAGTLISDKWNVKIYNTGSIVCTDFQILNDLENDSLKEPNKSLILLQIDDSGWGFPLLGVMVGVTDGKEVRTDVIPVEFFQEPLYESKAYLNEYASRGVAILNEMGVTPQTHRIEICTGYVNKNLKNALRDLSYDVRVAEIKGLLQAELESRFGEYVRKVLGHDLSYDPKEYDKSKLGSKYYSVLNWGKRYAPEMLKTGWKSIQKEARAKGMSDEFQKIYGGLNA